MRHCSTGKTCYTNEFLAEEALIHAMVKGGAAPDKPNGIYKCEICECFHLTSKSRDTSLLDSPEF
ncbi:MAG: hypothetical protein P8X57_08215, partial [Cyclobacteriaceae bacterium]